MTSIPIMPGRVLTTLAVLIVAAVLLEAKAGNAQGTWGRLILGHDGSYGECNIIDDGPDLKTVYVTHSVSGAIAVRFRVAPRWSTVTYVSETHSFPMTVGNAEDGMTVCYGSCRPGSFLVATLTYMSYGTSAPCGLLEVVPHPLAEVPEVQECNGQVFQSAARNIHVGSGGCGCPDGASIPGEPHPFSCEPLPVHESTWGAIKALYQ